MHPINILSLNRRISFINAGKYKKEYRKAMQCKLTKKSYQEQEPLHWINIDIRINKNDSCLNA